MSQLLRFNYIHILSIFSAIALFVSCDKEMNISLENVDDDIAVTLIDSFTINTSSYQLDFIPSALTGSMLVGKTNINDLGVVKSSSYFKVSLDAYNNNIPQDAVYDSITVVLRPNSSKYYYGDTTQNQTISVHRVTQEIVSENILTSIDNYNTPFYVGGATIFNNKKFNYDNTALGTKTFKPYMNAVDSISVRLNDNFGKEIFDKIVTNQYDVSNIEVFQNYLKGFVIVPDNNNTTLLGLNDTVNVNLNYSYIGTDGFKVTGKKVIIANNSTTLQFNNIEYDRTGTAFAALNATNRELSLAQTNNKLFIQSGTGITTKLKTPSLREFMHTENISINKAELIIETESLPYGQFPTANSLMLMITNKNGIPVNSVPTPFSNTAQQAAYIPGNDVGENGKYVFNLIDYIKYINANRYIDTDLLLSTVSPALFNTVNTVRIATENGKPKIKLNIVYTKFR